MILSIQVFGGEAARKGLLIIGVRLSRRMCGSPCSACPSAAGHELNTRERQYVAEFRRVQEIRSVQRPFNLCISIANGDGLNLVLPHLGGDRLVLEQRHQLPAGSIRCQERNQGGEHSPGLVA